MPPTSVPAIVSGAACAKVRKNSIGATLKGHMYTLLGIKQKFSQHLYLSARQNPFILVTYLHLIIFPQ